jgi:PAS domain S-box-containing protein
MAPDKEEQELVEEIVMDIGLGIDKIEQAKKQEQVEEALALTHFSIDHANDMLYWTGPDGKILNVNATTCEKLGYSRDELLSMRVDDIDPNISFEEYLRIWEAIKPRGTYTVETVHLSKDGRNIPVEVNLNYIKFNAQEYNYAFARDITERRQAEAALRESEQRFRNLIENSLTGISIVQDDRIIYQNPEQGRLFGPIPRSTIFASVDDIYPDDVEKVKQLYKNIISGKAEAFETDFRLLHKADKPEKRNLIWVNCRASLIEYHGKKAILVNVMDVTRTRQLENLLRIQDKMASLGRVAAGIAHEIRNPLSGVNIYLNTLEKIFNRDESLDKVNAILEQLQSASNKIESVIKRVLDFSKPNEPKFALTDINGPIDEAINLSSVTLRKSGIEIEKTLAENLPLCHADLSLIEEVVLNLITNAAEAMKHMEENKKIVIESSFENNRILLTVSDSGPGVPASIRDKIFDPFYTTKPEGSGIGLSITQRIISDHGASMVITDSKWGGAEFRIEMPTKGPGIGE